jgi:osmotically inducible lipoprotein OsmB
MKSKILAVMLLPLALSVSACGDTWGQRAATGGAIGTGAGLAVGALAGWPLLGPALAGAVVGAGIGAATAKDGPMGAK